MIALEATETCDFQLKLAQGEGRPRFRCRYLTVAEWLRVSGLIREADTADGPEKVDKLLAAIRVGLAGWEALRDANGEELPFDVDQLPEVASPAELHEIAWGVRDQPTLTELDRKNFVSPSTSAPPAGGAVNPGATAEATAVTS